MNNYPNNRQLYPQQYQGSVIPMHINTGPSKDLFQLLQSQFQYKQVQPATQYCQSAVVKLQTNDEIKIDQPFNIQTPPTITFHGQPYNYTTFYTWTNSSNLLELVKVVQEHIVAEMQIVSNPIIQEALEQTANLHYEEEMVKIRTLSAQQFLPALQPQEYQQWLNADETVLKSQIMEIQEIRLLKEKLMKLVGSNETLANLSQTNTEEIAKRLQEVNRKNNLLQEEYANYLQFYNRSTALSERCSDSKVLQVLEKLCNQFDDQSEGILERGLENNQGTEEQLLQYFQSRKKYQRTLIIAEKFRQMKQI